MLTLEMKWENWCVSDLLYYPQTEENVKKEMEDWSKQADEAKAEGWYLMLHKNTHLSLSMNDSRIVETFLSH